MKYIILAFLGVLVNVASSSPLQPRQSCYKECIYCWHKDVIQNATAIGCSYLANNNSPYKYPNLLNYTTDTTRANALPDPGPYYQYPAPADGSVYSGDDAGNFFVVFKKDCTYEGLVTNLPFADPSLQRAAKLVVQPGAVFAACL